MAVIRAGICLGKGAKYYRNIWAVGVRSCALLHLTPGVLTDSGCCAAQGAHAFWGHHQKGMARFRGKVWIYTCQEENYFSHHNELELILALLFSVQFCTIGTLFSPGHRWPTEGSALAGTTQICLCLGQVCREGAAVPLLGGGTSHNPLLSSSFLSHI